MHNDVMELLWNLDCRPYPAIVLTALGAFLALHGAVDMIRGFLLPYERPGKNLRTMRSMRICLQGIALAAIAVGWWFHWPVAVAAGLVFGFEETLETSIVVWALKQESELEGG